jgi:hypothetical protein
MKTNAIVGDEIIEFNPLLFPEGSAILEEIKNPGTFSNIRQNNTFTFRERSPHLFKLILKYLSDRRLEYLYEMIKEELPYYDLSPRNPKYPVIYQNFLDEENNWALTLTPESKYEGNSHDDIFKCLVRITEPVNYEYDDTEAEARVNALNKLQKADSLGISSPNLKQELLEELELREEDFIKTTSYVGAIEPRTLEPDTFMEFMGFSRFATFLDHPSIVIAGGCVVDYIRGLQKPKDVDIFALCNSDEELENIIRHIHANLMTLTSNVIIARTKLTLTFYLLDRKYQVILKNYTSVTEILVGFDLDACCFAYHMGTFLATKRAYFSYLSRTVFIDLSRTGMDYTHRVIKYMKKGYRVCVPYFKRELLNYYELVNKPDEELRNFSLILKYELYNSTQHCKRSAARFENSDEEGYDVGLPYCLPIQDTFDRFAEAGIIFHRNLQLTEEEREFDVRMPMFRLDSAKDNRMKLYSTCDIDSAIKLPDKFYDPNIMIFPAKLESFKKGIRELIMNENQRKILENPLYWYSDFLPPYDLSDIPSQKIANKPSLHCLEPIPSSFRPWETNNNNS